MKLGASSRSCHDACIALAQSRKSKRKRPTPTTDKETTKAGKHDRISTTCPRDDALGSATAGAICKTTLRKQSRFTRFRDVVAPGSIKRRFIKEQVSA